MVALGEAHKKPKQTRINLAQMIIDQKRLFPFVADDINKVAAILIDLVADGIERAAQAVGPVAGAELAPFFGVPDKNKIAMLGGSVFDRRCVAVGISLRRRLLVRGGFGGGHGLVRSGPRKSGHNRRVHRRPQKQATAKIIPIFAPTRKSARAIGR